MKNLVIFLILLGVFAIASAFTPQTLVYDSIAEEVMEDLLADDEVESDVEEFRGDMTYYLEATGAGACSFDSFGSTDTVMVAALNKPQFSNAAHCGRCALVTGPKGQQLVKIVDLCPECAWGALDLSRLAFSKLDEVSKGRVSMPWSFVPCPTSGSIQYKLKEGSNPWWVALQVRNHKVGVRSVEVLSQGTSSWVPLDRTEYNYFVKSFSAGIKTPFQVRVTSIDGQVVVGTINAYNAGSVVSGTAQFIGTEPTIVTSAPSTSAPATSAPSTGSQLVTVTKHSNANEWWIQINVTPSTSVTGITAKWNNCAAVPVTRTSWDPSQFTGSVNSCQIVGPVAFTITMNNGKTQVQTVNW